MEPKTKRSFWHFGRHLDKVFRTATGQTVIVAVLLFSFFKIIRSVQRAD
jgi:hypothetical protein